ncbi:MAG TPA: hypothetical protein VGH28_05090 [Polyangiaceae bacterium]|jgi:hypothetical protein
MKLFNDDTGWAEARRSIRFTRAALAAVAAHEKLAATMTKLLRDWKSIDDERLAAEDETVDANALVRFRDWELDDGVTRLAEKTKGDHGGDSKEFGALFPEAPHEVVRLGLASEIDRIKKWKAATESLSLSKNVRAQLGDIDKTCASGKKALDAREAAATSSTKIALRMEHWKDDANGARRSIETALADYANKHGLPRDYPSAFFPAPAARPKKKTTTPTPTAATQGA